MSTDLGDILSGAGASASEPAQTEQVSQPTPAVQPEAQAAPEAQQEAEQAHDGSGMVPVAALQAERQKAKRYTEQVADFQKKLEEQNTLIQQLFAQQRPAPQPQAQPEAPDFYTDPDGYLSSREQRLQQQFENTRLAQSEMLAVEKFGEEAVATAFQAFEQRVKSDPSMRAEHQRMMASPHPFRELVKWHQSSQAMAEIGSDPVAYKARLEAEIREKIMAESQTTQQPGQQQPPPVMPSNFTSGRNVGNRASGPAWAGPPPLQDIFAR